MWTITISAEAFRKLSRMPAKDAARIVRALHALKDNPFQHDFKPLKGLPLWRLRVGAWRVLCRVEREALTIIALSVGPRGDVYK
jgi:mRNA interferase RelE/StbE